MPEDKSLRKEVLRELLLTEEDTIRTLRSLIDKTKEIVKIDQKTSKIVLSANYEFLNSEKILLYLIGKYFCKELGLCETEGLDLNEMQNETGVKKTTLSKPLGELLHSGYIAHSDKRYFINHYKIGEAISYLHGKYVEGKTGVKPIIIKNGARQKKRAKGD